MTGEAPDDERPFGILFVCTGNICRSPIAEQLTVAALRARLDHPAGGAERVRVGSAGTFALVGHPIEPAAAQALHALGVTPARSGPARSPPSWSPAPTWSSP